MSDSQQIRELEQRLVDSEESADVLRQITLLNGLAWALSDTEMQRAYALSETAYTLASSPHDGTSPDQAGMAYSLRTQGYINQRLGDYPRGMTQLLKAQGLFESLGIEDGLADVFDGLAGIYAQIGDLAEALSYMYKQLDVAQRIGDQRRAANAYNNLGNIYFEFADYNRAIETFQHNLRLAGEIDDGRIICLSVANLSQVHLLAGDGSKALEYGLYALRVCREMGFGLFEAYALDLIGKSYRALGTPAQAIPYFEQALALSTRLESKVVEPLVLLSLGEVYRDMQQLDRALGCLSQAVAIAQAIDARSELSKGHLLLSEIYQQQGDLASALHHLKEYQAWREKVFNEKADQRLKVLQVAHDTETAKREAEILRLKAQQLEQEIIEQRKLDEALRLSHDDLERQVTARTAELNDTVALLRQEIAERLRAESEVEQMVETLEQRVAARTEELATFFDLILLAGQGIGLPKILKQVLPQVIEVTRSEAVGIDLLDADRSALILVAKENFPEELPARLPVEELPPEFQRWLEGPNDPLSMRDVENMPSLLSAFRSLGLQTYLGAQIRIGHRTEGVLSCFRFTERGYSADETALILALAHQIGLILEIDRLRTDAEAIAVLEERQRLARDLHDSVTQSLYSLSLFSRAALEATEDGDAGRLHYSLNEIERNTVQTLREMRMLLYELRPADLDQEGLTHAIELRLNAVERRANLQVDARLDELAGLSPRQEIDLYHIVVEALNNVVKHAAATCVTLNLTRDGECVRLRVMDDGRGFDPGKPGAGWACATSGSGSPGSTASLLLSASRAPARGWRR